MATDGYRAEFEPEKGSVWLEPLREASGAVMERFAEAGVHVAHRRGRIRISPHLYNTPDEIDRALDLL